MIKEFISTIKNHFKTLPDHRTGKNKSYTLSDVCMAAYSVFHMQSPSFLAHQEKLKKVHARHNGETLFDFQDIPSDNQMRNMLDKISPKEMNTLFEKLHDKINLEEFKGEDGLIVALDGVYFFSSEKISCKCCLTRKHEGKTRNYHSMLVPALIHPEQKCALPMAPEFMDQNDGDEKQDCEINSAKRWLGSKREWLTQNKVTLLGDDLFSRAPFINQICQEKDVRFIFVAKPTSHKYLAQWIADYHPEDIEIYKTSQKQGNKKHNYFYKIYQKVPLNGDAKSPEVNYFEMKVTNDKGQEVYYNTFVTNHAITSQNIHQIAKMGRNRWKIENEAFNILKTKGYHLEHNFGHGKEHLSNTLASLNLLAFLVHHLSEQLCAIYQKVRECFGARVRFFQTLSVMMSIQVYDSWDTFLHFVLSVSVPVVKPSKKLK
jgi:hypothetical protein